MEQIEDVYKQAGYDRKWNVVRRGAGLLGKLADSLAPGITTILVRGKVVSRCCFLFCDLEHFHAEEL